MFSAIKEPFWPFFIALGILFVIFFGWRVLFFSKKGGRFSAKDVGIFAGIIFILSPLLLVKAQAKEAVPCLLELLDGHKDDYKISEAIEKIDPTALKNDNAK